MAYRIAREGLMFRAVDEESGYRSPLVTSASQAGLIIQRRAGPHARREAADHFAVESARQFRDWHFAKKVAAVSH